MVIQSNMSPKAIAEVWELTVTIFEKYNIPLSEIAMEIFIDADIVTNLLFDLNNRVGSSATTCIAGG
jgi:hypothetical protein